MKAVKANIVKSLPMGAVVATCDNSGAKKIQIISVRGHKTVKGRLPAAGVGDYVTANVKSGLPGMKKTVVNAIIVRQKKEYRRGDGTRVKFEDNAAVVLKDERGTPKGTILKGPISKEAAEKWAGIAKLASIIV